MSGMIANNAKRLVIVSACFLLLSGILKLISAVHPVPLLRFSDPVFSILTNRQVLLIVGIMELLLAAGLLWRGLNYGLKWVLLCWFASGCFLYRLWKKIAEVSTPCPCLGNAADWLHVNPHVLDNAAQILLCLFAVSGLVVLCSGREISA